MQKIKNVVFDLGGVILDVDYNLTRIAFEKLGVTHFDEMYSQTTADQLFQKLETGKISETDFHAELNRCIGLHLSAKEINQAWNAMLLTFREDSLQFLDELSSRYKLFLLSNTNYIHMDAFKKIFHQRKRNKSFEEYFTSAFYSCEIGLRKPDAVCYQWLLQTIKMDPQNTLFIDDSIKNIEGAKNEGMQTILLKEGMQIENLSW